MNTNEQTIQSNEAYFRRLIDLFVSHTVLRCVYWHNNKAMKIVISSRTVGRSEIQGEGVAKCSRWEAPPVLTDFRKFWGAEGQPLPPWFPTALQYSRVVRLQVRQMFRRKCHRWRGADNTANWRILPANLANIYFRHWQNWQVVRYHHRHSQLQEI